jgi:hypothetical protein
MTSERAGRSDQYVCSAGRPGVATGPAREARRAPLRGPLTRAAGALTLAGNCAVGCRNTGGWAAHWLRGRRRTFARVTRTDQYQAHRMRRLVRGVREMRVISGEAGCRTSVRLAAGTGSSMFRPAAVANLRLPRRLSPSRRRQPPRPRLLPAPLGSFSLAAAAVERAQPKTTTRVQRPLLDAVESATRYNPIFASAAGLECLPVQAGIFCPPSLS